MSDHTKQEELRHKLVELRKQRSHHLIDESDYIDTVIDMFADVEGSAYNEGELDAKEYWEAEAIRQKLELLKSISWGSANDPTTIRDEDNGVYRVPEYIDRLERQALTKETE